MRKISLLIFSVLLVALAVFMIIENDNDATKNEEALTAVLELKEKHKEHLENHPFKEGLLLSKKERKANRMPPKKYFEEQWILTMNPELGRPTSNKVLELQQELLRSEEHTSELQS